MFYLVDTRTQLRIVKAEHRAHLEHILSALDYPHWEIVEDVTE